jgi:hypothetical protein
MPRRAVSESSVIERLLLSLHRLGAGQHPPTQQAHADVGLPYRDETWYAALRQPWSADETAAVFGETVAEAGSTEPQSQANHADQLTAQSTATPEVFAQMVHSLSRRSLSTPPMAEQPLVPAYSGAERRGPRRALNVRRPNFAARAQQIARTQAGAEPAPSTPMAAPPARTGTDDP